MVSAVIRAANATGAGVRVVREDAVPPEPVVDEARRALAALGFVVMPAVKDASRAVLHSVVGRHVALVCTPEDDPSAAAWWVRWLGRTSPRGHLVLLLGWEGRRRARLTRHVVARERATSYVEAAAPGLTCAAPAWLARAEAFKQRHRFSSAERWFRAAMAAACGRGDETMAAQAGTRLVDLLVAHGEAPRAWPLAIDLAERLKTWLPRAEVLTRAATALVAGGEMDRAEALVAALDAEAQVLNEDEPGATGACRAELAFWRGRFDRASCLLDRQSSMELGALGWSGLSAWARGDHVSLSALTEEAESRRRAGNLRDAEAAFWAVALRAAGVPGGATDRASEVLASARNGSKRLEALGRAIAAEILLTAGKEEQALAALEPDVARGSSPESWLHAWLRVRCAGNVEAQPALRARICRAGVQGVLRWGEGKNGMHLIHGLPALLQLVQDADDDQAALRGGCAWMRRQTGAAEVAIVTADEARVIASDGWTGADVSDQDATTAPIRYGRAVIARVIARGPDADRAVIEQGLQAVAALVAPAVRSRLDALVLSREADRAASEILGASPGMTSVREAIVRAALAGFPVLVEGESGTGKELVARAVHRLSARRDRPFAAVNCAALSDDLIEAELFGHARGAFTGAVGPRTGIFEWAHGGTLFLDEVGELSARGQAKVLRALQEREIRRVGENVSRTVDVRVVAATNVVLADAVVQGSFRQDLLFRLAVVRVRLPPLRERIEDIPLLAHAFWKPMAADRGVRARLGADALAALCRHSWPGNVRELQNAIAGLLVAAPARGRVTGRHVAQVLAITPPGESAVSLDAARELAERRAVTSALARHGGRRTAAATELGISRQGLAKALRRLGLSGLDTRAGVA